LHRSLRQPSLEFMLGQPIKVKGDLKIVIAGNDFNVPLGGASPIADFLVQLDAGHSAYWGGIESVVDANGHAVPFTLTSVSNHDWSASSIPAPVPLPGSGVLLLSAIGCMGHAARRLARGRRGANGG